MSLSLLAKNRTEICQKCGRCCKEYSCHGYSKDEQTRLTLLGDPKIFAKDDVMYFKKVCQMLESKNGVYSCRIHESQDRPVFCREYPDNIPVSAWGVEKEICPIIKIAYEKLDLENCENKDHKLG
jgi:Fe-S-cluster containining protein